MEGAGALETNEMLSVTFAEKTKTLNRQRGSYKAKITKLQSFLKDKASNAEQLLLQIKLDKVSEMYSSMEALKIEYYEVVEDEQLPNLELILEEMEDDLEEIKVGLQTLLKHDDISKNVSICNTALSNNDFLIVPMITDFVPSIQPNLKIKRFNDINRSILADPSFDKPGKIDMIIGAELFYQILKDGRKVISDNVTLINSVFGFIVSGSVNAINHKSNCFLISESENIDNCIKKFWERERSRGNHPG
ncbi:DUF1758 domain-containing protein [Trichonephila clavata]|uniref:DUF1758 domain-containing protein n=1 Tax=Trichonephila clavata TaxID=2740835 RepID=A0A8X6FW03_TRICU|nr:DUF1758 domain-containing protein [Trichonephila clavata]